MNINMSVSEKIRNHQSFQIGRNGQKSIISRRRKMSLHEADVKAVIFDMKPLMMDPEGSTLLAELMEIYIDNLEPDFVGGLELGAVH